MKKSIYTRAVHSGKKNGKVDFIPVSTPIYNTSTYYYKSMEDLDRVFSGDKKGYVYSRYGNPTNSALQEALATLEGGDCAFTFSSGMAAIHAALMAIGLKPGDHILASQDLYGATHSLLTSTFGSLGIEPHFIEISDVEQVESVMEAYHPKTFIFEVMSNPLLKIADVPALVNIAHTHGILIIIDSTFTTPFLVQPLQYKADLVMHSTTKYLNGHGDVTGGAVISMQELGEPLYELTKLLGAILGPNEAYLTLRGLKTFPLRMKRHCENALEVAHYLEDHPRIERVYYPGLKSHPQHDLASRLFSPGFYGGMISFEIKDAGRKEVFHFFERLELIIPATSLGDVYSLIVYPAHSSHRTLNEKERRDTGITDGLVRLSVGIEDPSDIIADIEQALGTP
ncbi:MAG: aminotransferase class I/II-fold pyridoxal phosphate-dependent enzyme [Theionarchaea archaeon]|nr:aminotransferase class I/II-fold pyridoxal phosphate-dependent enzyme [Theionarchaea archaeon]